MKDFLKIWYKMSEAFFIGPILNIMMWINILFLQYDIRHKEEMMEASKKLYMITTRLGIASLLLILLAVTINFIASIYVPKVLKKEEEQYKELISNRVNK